MVNSDVAVGASATPAERRVSVTVFAEETAPTATAGKAVVAGADDDTVWAGAVWAAARFRPGSNAKAKAAHAEAYTRKWGRDIGRPRIPVVGARHPGESITGGPYLCAAFITLHRGRGRHDQSW
ncbi:hypothetical protein GCM10022270_17200 [Terriglobus aquaticus]